MNNLPKYPVSPKWPMTEDCKVLKYSVTTFIDGREKCTGLTTLENAERIARNQIRRGGLPLIEAKYTTGVYAI